MRLGECKVGDRIVFVTDDDLLPVAVVKRKFVRDGVHVVRVCYGGIKYEVWDAQMPCVRIMEAA